MTNPANAHSQRRQELLSRAKSTKSREQARDLAYAYWREIYCEPGYTEWLVDAPHWVKATHEALMWKSRATISALALSCEASKAAYDSFSETGYDLRPLEDHRT